VEKVKSKTRVKNKQRGVMIYPETRWAYIGESSNSICKKTPALREKG